MAKASKAEAKAPAKNSGSVECAVLCDCVYGKHNDIIELDADIAQAAFEAGYVDTHPNAMKAIRAKAG